MITVRLFVIFRWSASRLCTGSCLAMVARVDLWVGGTGFVLATHVVGMRLDEVRDCIQTFKQLPVIECCCFKEVSSRPFHRSGIYPDGILLVEKIHVHHHPFP